MPKITELFNALIDNGFDVLTAYDIMNVFFSWRLDTELKRLVAYGMKTSINHGNLTPTTPLGKRMIATVTLKRISKICYS